MITCIKVMNRIALTPDKDALIAVTGWGEAVVRGQGRTLRFDPWRAIVVPANTVLEVRAKGEAYVAVKGLVPNGGMLGGGVRLICEPIRRMPEDLHARYVPPTLLDRLSREDGGALKLVWRHLELVKEAVRRGAKLVKVKVNGRQYDVWVEELE